MYLILIRLNLFSVSNRIFRLKNIGNAIASYSEAGHKEVRTL